MALVDFSFAGLDLMTDDRLLTPRAWTAEQSAWAADLLGELPPGPVLELCAGAGHIGLAGIRGTGRRLVAVDREDSATTRVLANADRLGMADRVEVRCSAVDRAVEPDELFALVIADPPWVPHDLLGEYPDDPPEAIDGGGDGLDIARECVQVIGRHLDPDGVALLQLGTSDQVALLALPPTLVVGEVREYPRGVLVSLRRPGPPGARAQP